MYAIVTEDAGNVYRHMSGYTHTYTLKTSPYTSGPSGKVLKWHKANT